MAVTLSFCVAACKSASVALAHRDRPVVVLMYWRVAFWRSGISLTTGSFRAGRAAVSASPVSTSPTGWTSTATRSSDATSASDSCRRATTSRKNASCGHPPGKAKWVGLQKRAKTEAASIHQAYETEISLVAVCSFVVSLECADHFYNHWIDRLYGYGNFYYCFRGDRSAKYTPLEPNSS